jgi:lipopolysaccharide heptosyltransferase I
LNILIVRLGSLGDIIHAIPAAAAIRRVHPHATIHWLVDVRHEELLELVESINTRVAVNTSDAGSIFRTVRRLRERHFDIAIDLQGLLKSAVLARLSRAGRVIGFPAPLLREKAAGLFYTETEGDLAARHVIDKNLSILKALGIRVPDVEFPLVDRKSEIVSAARSGLGIGSGDRFALINPGAAWPNKRWPPVYYAEVARALAKRYHLRSLVLWGPGEREIGQRVVDASEGTAALSPPTSIADLVSLTKAAAVMISGDTGPLHVAGAVGTPLVGIFGPTDPNRNGPWADEDFSASRFQSCVCHYQRRCRIAGWCLLDISPREVMNLVDRRLTGLPAHA